MNEYLKLLFDKKTDQAIGLRNKSIPKKLIKFFSLSEDQMLNSQKLTTLKEQKIWFSSVNSLNDPYEFKSMYLNETILKGKRYPQVFIDYYKNMLDGGSQKLLVASFSGNSFDCIPMWAYYANNHKGFCVEYDVENTNMIYPVQYEPNRIPIARIAVEHFMSFSKIQSKTGKEVEDFKFYNEILKHQFLIKHSSWSHENEYRILCPKGNCEKGRLVSLKLLGLKTSKIVAGVNCKKENIEKLKEIANEISCPMLQTQISTNEFTLLEEV
ncbi:MAG: DUF2971 domain-containing protein [Clostridiales bacterium]|nr:DUF2971 domain-containing protein [Candidatus Coliplasma equi]